MQVNPETNRHLTALAEKKPHALLLSGPEGVGLSTLAVHTARNWGTLLEVVRPVAKSKTSLPAISIDGIRELYQRTRLKPESTHIAVIDEADTMTDSAQNALLKLLEEPSLNVHFILTSHSPDALIPTVRSRVQHIAVRPIDAASSVRLLRSLGITDDTIRHQMLYLAQGLPAELYRMATDQQYFTKRSETVRMAKRFISGTVYDRLTIASQVASSRQHALEFIDNALLLLKKSITTSQDEKLINLVDKLIEAKAHIEMNGNVRLQIATTVV